MGPLPARSVTAKSPSSTSASPSTHSRARRRSRSRNHVVSVTTSSSALQPMRTYQAVSSADATSDGNASSISLDEPRRVNGRWKLAYVA
jgi:hypothetical protein